MSNFLKTRYRCIKCGTFKEKEETKYSTNPYCYSKECRKDEERVDNRGNKYIRRIGTFMTNEGKVPMTKCEHCTEEMLDEDVWECHDEPHHGSNFDCDECEASYYEEWGSEERYATNLQAQFNYPKMKKL